ncbi:hypothetical protein Tdes44962_MAKER07376 [Teratosphaeria destructans]|uniref:Herpesvirus latent membrane 1 (LMP1) domain-containing protein n=1 Tax=Teratosphaeria destructans TaxID=418781 RepID=A0A9W7SZF4_9PEZI|nr:hypothetical protein Tdes44962_MAKER07376 [Teratosphaeria destructans]
MANLLTLARRQASTVPIPHTMIALLVVLLVLLIMILLLIAALYFFRQRRTRAHRPDLLPVYEDAEKRLSTASTSSHHRRVMVRPSESVYVISEKGIPLDETAPSTPTSSIPEIRITFPEEFDDLGKRKSGRVVVVRVGDTSVGLEPVSVEEKPPVYDQHDERFQSLDLDRVGGLVEKARNAPSKEYQ